MGKLKVAVSYSPEVGGVSVLSLRKSLSSVDFDVIDADYRAMMRDIPPEEFELAYLTHEGRASLFAHAKHMANIILDDTSCLMLSGNISMIDPLLFNESRDPNESYDVSRTIAELALIHVATQKGMPIMGVCGGHQAFAVYNGSTVRALTTTELEKQGYRAYDKVIVNVASLLGQIFKIQKTDLLSNELTMDKRFFGAHKQVVNQLGPYLNVTAWASDGQLIEAIEKESGAPAIGTQFHPEITVHGLPPDSADIGNEEEIREALKLFNFFKKAAQAFDDKKALQSELKQNIPKIKGRTLKKEEDRQVPTGQEVKQSLALQTNNPKANPTVEVPSKIMRNNPARFWKERQDKSSDNIASEQERFII